MKNILFEQIVKPKRSRGRKSTNSRGVKDSILGFDSGPVGKNEELVISRSSRGWNMALFAAIAFLVFFTFLARAFSLQIIEGPENFDLAEGNRVRVSAIMAERGLITDTRGEVVARNKPAFSIIFDNEKCSRDSDMETCLSTVVAFAHEFNLETDLDRIKEDLSKARGEIVVKPNLTKEELLPTEVRLGEFSLFSVHTAPVRDYLYGEAFAHLIGYVGYADTSTPKIEGKTGIEMSYNDLLSGVDGGEIFQVDSSGSRIGILSERRSIPGSSVELYADLGLQQRAFDLLKQAVDEGDATGGAVVAQDPRTGGVLALVSYPAFDPNKLSSGLTQAEFAQISSDSSFPFFNRVISATYPPASTFKMIVAAAALMEDTISPTYEIFDNGFIQVGSFIFRNWNLGGHGLVDMRRALQVSNDTYFYTIGGGYGGVGGLGIDAISRWSKTFGFGEPSGIDLPGEEAGFVPNADYRDWYLGDTYITSIGQGDLLATPLQVNNVTNFYANGGVLWKPSVVKAIDGQTQETEVLGQDFIDDNAYNIVREGLKMAVEPGGTGYPFFDFPAAHDGIEVAGKTGTAEFGGADSEDTHAWFTVFGPYDLADEEHEPISLTVFLEGGGGGSDDAAPIARQLFDYWFSKN